jgi:hypothetical protein
MTSHQATLPEQEGTPRGTHFRASPLLRAGIVIELKLTSASRKSEVADSGITTFWISIVLDCGASSGCGALRAGVLTLSSGLVAPSCACSAFQHERWLKQNLLGLFTPDDG